MEIVSSGRFTRLRRFFATLRARTKYDLMVIPEVDNLLIELCLLRLVRRLPERTVGIMMRPPNRSIRFRGYSKRALIGVVRRLRSVSILFLEDPLADGGTAVWPLHYPKLLDPSDLYLSRSTSLLPPEVEGLPEDVPMIGILGAIDERKNVPLVLSAWAHGQHGRHAVLVVAGRQAASVTARIRPQLSDDKSIVAVNRYLSNGELGALLSRCHGLVLLYSSENENGISSGTVIAAAAQGRWVIARAGSRILKTIQPHGLGIGTELSVASLSEAIGEALQRRRLPLPLELPKSESFGDRVLDPGSVGTGR
jgi:glycosyltransferase involved in cell wall biosynthesis